MQWKCFHVCETKFLIHAFGGRVAGEERIPDIKGRNGARGLKKEEWVFELTRSIFEELKKILVISFIKS